MIDHSALLLGGLHDCAVLAGASPCQWERVIRQAREANVLGTLADDLRARGYIDAVPPAPRAHLQSILAVAEAQVLATRREVAEIAKALAGVVSPIVLLKGSAYLLAELPAACGRLFSDIDILVPRDTLPEVESAMMLAGFATTHLHPYDQRYYRRWTHELPPMQHVKRLTIVDVHHAIVPPTSRARHDSRLLLQGAQTLDDAPQLAVLAPADMVLHSAAHLFNDEEMGHGLRDLVDLDRLLRHFARDPAFADALPERARMLNLERPLYYALRWSTRVLGTPLPERCIQRAESGAPGMATLRLMDALLRRALRPTVARASTRWARRALYVRGHWLKMPPHLLAWHLAAKSLRRNEM